MASWTRGTVVVQGNPGPKMQAGNAGGQVFKGAMVVSCSPRNVVLKTADGGKVEATLIGAKGFDLDGEPAGRGDALMKPGNFIDVTIAPIPTSKIGLQAITEFRLVRIGDGAPAPKP